MAGTVGKELEERGLQIVTESEADATTVFNTTTDKHAGIDQYFFEFEDYKLLYPDIKFCNLLPGCNKFFTIEKYKHFLNKSFSVLTCLFGNTLFEILKADESYFKKVEEYLTEIINNPIAAEDHNEAATYLTENNTLGTSFEDDSYIYILAPLSRQIFF